MSHAQAESWIKVRLDSRGVFEEGGKWKAVLRGEDVGTFDGKAEALKAYRKAALDKFGEQAVLPSDEDIDAASTAQELPKPHPASPKHEPPKPPPRNTRR